MDAQYGQYGVQTDLLRDEPSFSKADSVVLRHILGMSRYTRHGYVVELTCKTCARLRWPQTVYHD